MTTADTLRAVLWGCGVLGLLMIVSTFASAYHREESAVWAAAMAAEHAVYAVCVYGVCRGGDRLIGLTMDRRPPASPPRL